MAEIKDTTPAAANIEFACIDQLAEAEYGLACISELMEAVGDEGITGGSAQWLGEQIAVVANRVGEVRVMLLKQGVSEGADTPTEAEEAEFLNAVRNAPEWKRAILQRVMDRHRDGMAVDESFALMQREFAEAARDGANPEGAA